MKKIFTIIMLVFPVVSALQAANEEYLAPSSTILAVEENDDFVTKDLAAFMLHGHVQKMIEGETIYIFDKAGNLVRCYDDYGENDVNTDDDGSVSIYTPGAGSNIYTVDTRHMRLSEVAGGEGGFAWKHVYKYDAAGKLLSVNSEYIDYGENTKEVERNNVVILNKDAHGNWTKMKRGKGTYSRTIHYFSNNSSETDEEDFSDAKNPHRDHFSFRGRIGGDKKATLTLDDGEGDYTFINFKRNITVDTYSEATGHLVISAWYQSNGNYVGKFDGTYRNGVYKGVFTNTKGGKVDFELRE